MTRTEHLLFILTEECAEVAHRCSKAARFTLGEKQAENELTPDSELTRESKYSNAERISLELTDIIEVAEMLRSEGSIPEFNQEHLKDSKKYKVDKFLGYSRNVGALS